MKVTQLNKDRIIRIPIDLTLSCKTWKMTIKKEFNGKVRKDIIQTTREGGIKSCDLNNIFTISEYIAYHELEDRKMLDEELEAGIKDGFESVIKYIKITADKIEEEEGKLPKKWSSDGYIIIYDTFATVALEISVEDFLAINSDAKSFLSEDSISAIKSIIVAEDKGLIMLIGNDDEILSADLTED